MGARYPYAKSAAPRANALPNFPGHAHLRPVPVASHFIDDAGRLRPIDEFGSAWEDMWEREARRSIRIGHGTAKPKPWAGIRAVARSGLQHWWLNGVAIGFESAVDYYAAHLAAAERQMYGEYWNKCWTTPDGWSEIRYHPHNSCNAPFAFYDAEEGGWHVSVPVPNGWTHVQTGQHVMGMYGWVFRPAGVYERLANVPEPTPLPQTVSTPARYLPGLNPDFFPAVHPAVDPHSQPVGQFEPIPPALPWRQLPNRVPNPNRHPSFQPSFGPQPAWRPRPFSPVPGVTVHPQPGPGSAPTIVVQPGVGRPPAPGPHRRVPPGKGGKERKTMNGRGAPAFFMGGINAVTEAGDMIDAAWKAIPEVHRSRGGLGLHEKLGEVANYVGNTNGDEFADWADDFLDNWRDNSVKDFAFGTMGRASAKATQGNPTWASPTGPQAGPWDRPPRPSDRKPRDRWGRFGGYRPRG